MTLDDIIPELRVRPGLRLDTGVEALAAVLRPAPNRQWCR